MATARAKAMTSPLIAVCESVSSRRGGELRWAMNVPICIGVIPDGPHYKAATGIRIGVFAFLCNIKMRERIGERAYWANHRKLRADSLGHERRHDDAGYRDFLGVI